ncbi:hypothetical protein C8J57DRAFT_1345236 [Mycena rebaudengoi]|nr:hypothetical protein C8J57DRAFT_1345236 [Mycena rebaudengoi]
MPQNLSKAAEKSRRKPIDPDFAEENVADSTHPATDDEVDTDEPPSKRAKRSNKKGGKKPAKAAESDAVSDIREVVYNLEIYSPTELRKGPKKRQPSHCGFMTMSSDVPFYRFATKLMAKVTSVAKLAVSVEDDELGTSFLVNRYVKHSLELDDSDSYRHMVTSALKNKDAVVTLIIELKILEPTDTESEAPPKDKKKKGKKSKIPAENDILPANAIINNYITKLRSKWTCHANDGSDFCWVAGEAKDHLPLTFSHFSLWAAGWANGSCDDETPPNHALFTKKGGAVAPPNLLQRRIAAAQQAGPAAPTINNNFTLPDGLVNLLRPAPPTAPIPHLVTLPAAQSMLLPPNMQVGERLPIPDFCQRYDLDDSIAHKLTTNGYKTAAVFYLIKLEDLPTMNFLPGEIAELRDAVQRWALPL